MLQADCVHGLLDATSRLRELRPPPSTARLVVAINLPLTSQSQIIAFFSNDYFTTFFDRKSATQTWIPLEESRSIVREWSLELPPGFSERGFQEHFFEDDYEEHGEMWFLGEL